MDMEKETDIDALARMIANGLSSIDNQFEALRSDVTVMKSDIKEIKADLRQTNHLIDTAILPTLGEHAHRIKVLEEHIA